MICRLKLDSFAGVVLSEIWETSPRFMNMSKEVLMNELSKAHALGRVSTAEEQVLSFLTASTCFPDFRVTWSKCLPCNTGVDVTESPECRSTQDQY